MHSNSDVLHIIVIIPLQCLSSNCVFERIYGFVLCVNARKRVQIFRSWNFDIFVRFTQSSGIKASRSISGSSGFDTLWSNHTIESEIEPKM